MEEMNMVQIVVEEEFRRLWPSFAGAAVEATVSNTPSDEGLWAEIDAFSQQYRARHTAESIKMLPSVRATRAAYKAFGKDPSRYRPSSEALCRRILRGLPLYRIDTLVDLVNYVSIATGYSIGGFDVDRLDGDRLTLGIGREGEPYEGIGRGMLNIERMPVYRDASGGVGTPTSDNERTKLSLGTTRFLALINGYDGGAALDEAVERMDDLLQRFVQARDLQVTYYK